MRKTQRELIRMLTIPATLNSQRDSAPTCFDGIVHRLSETPLVGPGDAPGYGAIFNAGLLYHNDRYHLFARGIRDGYERNPGEGPRFLNYVSDVLLFTSVDGISYTFVEVLLRSDECGLYAIEDPRVQRVTSNGEEQIVMTYTKLYDPTSGRPWQIGAHRLFIDGEHLVVDHSSATTLGHSQLADKDALVFNLADGRVAFMHRLHPDMQIAIFDDLDQLWNATDENYWEEHVAELDRHVIIRPAVTSLGVGAGAPTLSSDNGLWLFFHERRADGHYTMKVALLDHATGKVCALLTKPIMEPTLPWECDGDVDNVVFVQGVHRIDDDTIYLTYGAADKYVSAVTIHEPTLLDAFAVHGSC
jgi:beta-1,2-mannobiose phosphorylase / 1,2-beta-oligomannan phosphorylase